MMKMMMMIIIIIIIIITHSNQLYAVLRLEAVTFPGIINSPPSMQSDLSSQFHTFHVPCINQVHTNFWRNKMCTWIYKCNFHYIHKSKCIFFGPLEIFLRFIAVLRSHHVWSLSWAILTHLTHCQQSKIIYCGLISTHWNFICILLLITLNIST